jgi:Fic family protein
LDESLTPKNRPLEHSLMTVDHYKALKYVLELSGSKEKLTVDHIRSISSLVLKGTGGVISTMAGDFDSSKGEFRKATVRAGNRTFMDYGKVPGKVKELVDYVNNDIARNGGYYDNSLMAFDVHFQMVSIHPFADGNGRVSRLMMNYVQAYHGQPLTIVFKEDKQDYFQALEETRVKGDIEIFRKFMFGQALKYFRQEIELLSREQKQGKSNGHGLSYLF